MQTARRALSSGPSRLCGSLYAQGQAEPHAQLRARASAAPGTHISIQEPSCPFNASPSLLAFPRCCRKAEEAPHPLQQISPRAAESPCSSGGRRCFLVGAPGHPKYPTSRADGQPEATREVLPGHLIHQPEPPAEPGSTRTRGTDLLLRRASPARPSLSALCSPVRCRTPWLLAGTVGPDTALSPLNKPGQRSLRCAGLRSG